MELITAITTLWQSISVWMVEVTSDLSVLFFDPTGNGLTFLGVLAVAGLGISIIFLLIGFIQKFLHFRG